MKALTIRQPWADLVASGAKRQETRSWGTSYRGELAIHAGKARGGLPRLLNGARNLFGVVDAPILSALVELDPAAMSFGAVIAVATLADVVLMNEDLIEAQTPLERAFGTWVVGGFAWILEDVRRLARPLMHQGRQGLWEVEIPFWETDGVVRP